MFYTFFTCGHFIFSACILFCFVFYIIRQVSTSDVLSMIHLFSNVIHLFSTSDTCARCIYFHMWFLHFMWFFIHNFFIFISSLLILTQFLPKIYIHEENYTWSTNMIYISADMVILSWWSIIIIIIIISQITSAEFLDLLAEGLVYRGITV